MRAALTASGLLPFLDQFLYFLAALVAYLLKELVAVLLSGHLPALLSAFLARFPNGHLTFLGHDGHLLSTDRCANAALQAVYGTATIS